MPSHPAHDPRPPSRGTLFVVATPIGNLEDITLRALRILREVDVIAAEDTRHTARLLNHYGITTPMLSLHEHNERERVQRVVARLAGGASIALVSDAGTPLISDPGAELVAAARASGAPVIAIPGASAVLTALVASGVVVNEFSFLGFPPKTSVARKEWLRRAASESRTLVIYEAPHRLRDTLRDMVEPFGERTVVMARELTKVHEEYVSGTAETLSVSVEQPKGEVVLVIGPDQQGGHLSAPEPTPAHVYDEFCRLTDNARSTRRDAVAALARRFALPARSIYQLIETAKESTAGQPDCANEKPGPCAAKQSWTVSASENPVPDHTGEQ